MEELGIECQVGHPAKIRAAEPRKQKHDRRDADLILKLLVENRYPKIWLPSKEQQDLRALLRQRHQWVRIRTRIQNALQAIALANGLRRAPALWSPGRTKNHSVVAVGATYRLSAERVAGDVREVRGGDRKTKPASEGASLRACRSTAADDPPRSGTSHGLSDGGVSGRSRPVH